jgi:coiled-coil domain-containing protein 77
VQALSDAHNFLFEERQRLLALQAENDDLKLQEVQDRQRIQQLLAMTQPYEQEMTYSKAGPPQTTTSQLGRDAGGAAGGGAAGGGGGTRVLRTVFLPTANADVLALRVESLQAQLNEQVGPGGRGLRARLLLLLELLLAQPAAAADPSPPPSTRPRQAQVAHERIAALLEDRRVREGEWGRQRANYELQVTQLAGKLRRAEEVLRQVTKEAILGGCRGGGGGGVNGAMLRAAGAGR